MPKFVGWYRTTGWTDKLPFYQFKCDKCNMTVVNYPMTHNEKLLCPLCLEREWTLIEEEANQRANTLHINRLKHSEPIQFATG